MLYRIALFCLLSLALTASCDLRSGTAKKEMERYSDTPPPAPLGIPSPAASPVDPSQVVEVDTTVEGDDVGINSFNEKKALTCTKFNRVKVNGDRNTLTINGPCRQIMVNGDSNHITADATMEIVFNGSDNSVTYSRAVNGKRPTVTQSREGNIVEQVSKPKNRT